MNTARLLNPSSVVLVTALHAALLALYWQAQPPQLDLSTDSLSYVDLSGLSISGATATTTAAQPLPPHNTPQPPPKPKATEKAKPALKPVAKPTTNGDIAQTKDTPKPEPQEQAQPVAKTEPPPQSVHSGGQNTRQDNQGSGAGAQGSERGSGNASADGGNSAGSLVPPTHLGSHLGNPKPPYPPLSRENGEEGSVGLRVQVSADGRAQNVAVVKSSGHPRLDRSARQAVEKYRFRPATRGGVAIPYNYTFSIRFSLRTG